MSKNKDYKTIAFYTTKRQAEWIEDMAKVNGRSKSYIIRLAVEKLIEMTGGY